MRGEGVDFVWLLAPCSRRVLTQLFFIIFPSCLLFFFASAPVSAMRVELGLEKSLPHRDPALRLPRRSSPSTSTAPSFAPWVSTRISYTRTRSPTASRKFLI